MKMVKSSKLYNIQKKILYCWLLVVHIYPYKYTEILKLFTPFDSFHLFPLFPTLYFSIHNAMYVFAIKLYRKSSS